MAQTAEDLENKDAMNRKEKEDEAKVVNMGRNDKTNLDRINQRVSAEKIKLQQGLQSTIQTDSYQSMPT